MLNLDNVKASGERLALEAELSMRNQLFQDNLKAARSGEPNKFAACFSYAKDIVQLLEEINKINDSKTP